MLFASITSKPFAQLYSRLFLFLAKRARMSEYNRKGNIRIHQIVSLNSQTRDKEIDLLDSIINFIITYSFLNLVLNDLICH